MNTRKYLAFCVLWKCCTRWSLQFPSACMNLHTDKNRTNVGGYLSKFNSRFHLRYIWRRLFRELIKASADLVRDLTPGQLRWADGAAMTEGKHHFRKYARRQKRKLADKRRFANSTPFQPTPEKVWHYQAINVKNAQRRTDCHFRQTEHP